MTKYIDKDGRFNHGKWLREQYVTEADGTGIFTPGDMYTNDFDYVGMLEWGANAPDITFDNLGTCLLYTSDAADE